MNYGKSVKNIFNLVHHFGNEEDQISACFGFILYANKEALLDFLKILDIEISNKELKRIDIETQVPYEIGSKSRGVIDLQIKLVNEFIIFIESKLGRTKLSDNQLDNYSNILNEKRREFKKVRLIFITQGDRKTEFLSLKDKLNLKDNEFKYFRWEDIRKLVEKYKTGKQKFINELFFDYVGDKMSDKKIIEEQRIKDLEEVLIITTRPEWWELAEKSRIACHENPTPDVQFVAFYRTDPINAITHIAKVIFTEKNIISRETYEKFRCPKIIKIGTEKGWIDEPHKEYHLDKLIELPIPIKRSHGEPGIRTKKFTTISKILAARKLSDL